MSPRTPLNTLLTDLMTDRQGKKMVGNKIKIIPACKKNCVCKKIQLSIDDGICFIYISKYIS